MKQADDTKTLDILTKLDATKRGRKPSTPADPVTDVVPAAVAATFSAAATELTVADEAVLRSSRIYMAVGRIQATHFIETASGRLMAETYLEVKRLFKEINELPVQLHDGGRKIVSSLDEFCEVVMGKTSRRCRQLVENLQLLGPELFEQSERLGLRQRDYAAIKALPDDSQAAVRQALESGDKIAVLDLLQEFAVRVEAAKKAEADAQEVAEARQRLLDDKNAQIDRLEERASKPYKPGPHAAARTAAEKVLLDALQDAAIAANGALNTVVEVMTDMAGADISESCRLAAHNDLIWLGQRLAEVMREHGVDFNLDAEVVPSWVREQQAKLKAVKA